jgi:hypothetical protein
MKYTYAFLLAVLASLAAANPAPVPHAKPIPQAPKSPGAGCQSNAWEKVHEGHGHNINDGSVGGAPAGLKLPGGNGCYKGQKSP